MSALTKEEREGLEDVYLSIHSHKKKYSKLKEISSIIMSPPSVLNFSKLLKQAKSGLKEIKISQYILSLGKKKKKLSK